MKILLIGGSGTIGQVVHRHFAPKHEMVSAGRNSGDIRVDISDSRSIAALFDQVGALDAAVCIAGEAKWAPMPDLSEQDYFIGINSKLMGQVNLVRIGSNFINPGGSITLTTGILADDPVLMTTSAAMVNGAIHSFVKAAALELQGKIRLNAVSPGLVEDAYEKYRDYFPGHIPVAMKRVVSAYERSIEGSTSGEIIRVNG